MPIYLVQKYTHAETSMLPVGHCDLDGADQVLGNMCQYMTLI